MQYEGCAVSAERSRLLHFLNQESLVWAALRPPDVGCLLNLARGHSPSLH